MSPAPPIALVLSGGAAKGAYQAGVWQGLAEFGLASRVRAISGTSVGAINAAAFATIRNPIHIRTFWLRHVAEIPSPNYDTLLRPDVWGRLLSSLSEGSPASFPFHGLLDRQVLEGILDSLLPAEWPADSPSVYATALDSGTVPWRVVRFLVHREPDPRRRLQALLASAAIPWAFDPVVIDGRRFVDGGWTDKGGDNLPVAPILGYHPDIHDILAVRCNPPGEDPPLPSVAPPVRILVIQPSSPLPGLFDGTLLAGRSSRIDSWRACLAFSSACAAASYRRGLSDARRAIPAFFPH